MKANERIMSATLTIQPRERDFSRPGALAWLRPSLLDALLVSLLVWLIGYTASGGPAGLLQDAGTGVHIRTGSLILHRHAVPRWDVFSFTHDGQPWFAWEWLSDVIFSWLWQWAGLKGIVLLSAILITAAFGIVVRQMIRRGASALTALFLVHVGIAVSSVHFLARPHLFTLFLIALSLYLIELDRATPSRRILLLIPLAALWANLHGGFMALPVSLLSFAAGDAIAFLFGRTEALARAKRYALLAVGCLVASGLNPYGFAEHVHLIRYMNAEWIRRLVLEFQPPQFEGVPGLYAELLVLASGVLVFRLLARAEFGSALLVGFWLNAAMHSVRHLPVLAIVALPLAAPEVQQAWNWCVARARRGSALAVLDSIGNDHSRGLARLSIWPALAIAAIAFTSMLPFPVDFPEPRYPVSLVTKNADLLAISQVFSTDAVGDYLIYRLSPRVRVFVDGRSDMYGQKLIDEYLTVLNGGRGWDTILARSGTNAALVPANCALASLLRGRAGWVTLEDGPNFAFFRRKIL